MTYHIITRKRALKELEYFLKHDQIVFKKIQNLLKTLREDPYDKTAKTELLRFELSGFRSKRITKQHRLVYQIDGNNIIIISCRHHY